ncbi:MAG: CBS domain-containing protein [Thermodesulfobacteriota bacterium]
MEVISAHTNADFDTLASMIAAKKLYPEAKLVFPGSLEKALKKALSTVNLNYKFHKIKEIDLALVTRLILVDVRSPARIGGFASITDRPGLEIHIYDHHPAGEGDLTGEVEVVKGYGSTTTVLVEILREKGLEVTPAEATVMMAGIYEDTGSLTYPSTTENDFLAAAFLLGLGADLSLLSDMLSRELTPYEVSFLNELLQNETTVNFGGRDIVIAEGTFTKHSGDISVLAHKMRDIEGMESLFMLVDSGDRVHVVARSKATGVNVGLVLKILGGGGHAHAASATLKGHTLTEARGALLEALKEGVLPAERAVDIMSFPAITVEKRTSLQNAAVVLGRYNINAVPVVVDGAFAGIITRQTIDKAMHHGLGKEIVGDFMTIENECVEPETSVEEIREMFIRHGQRLIPVVSDQGLRGVITRTDILRLLQKEMGGDHGTGPRVKDVSRHMRERLPGWLMEILASLGSVAEALGCRAYVVGGFVRDLLLERENLDVDIVIEGGSAITFARCFARENNLKVRSHKRFKTAVLIFPEGFKVDVATARLEYYESPGALPTVEQSSLKLDIYRRDFILNTLAVELNPPAFGSLIDFFGGMRDIKEKKIRVLHNLSFIEDPTRAFRAVRFSVKFGFTIEPHTRNLIKKAVRLGVFKHLSGPRILEELQSILDEETAVKAIKALNKLGLLGIIHGGITFDAAREAFLERGREALGWYRLLYTGEEAAGWLVLFLVLTDGLGGVDLRVARDRLSIVDKRAVDIISKRLACQQALKHLASTSRFTNSQLYNLLAPLPIEGLLYMMARTEDDNIKKAISTYITRLRDVAPALTGGDLLGLGITEGPEIGRVLTVLLQKRLDGEILNKEGEIAFVKGSQGKGGKGGTTAFS